MSTVCCAIGGRSSGSCHGKGNTLIRERDVLSDDGAGVSVVAVSSDPVLEDDGGRESEESKGERVCILDLASITDEGARDDVDGEAAVETAAVWLNGGSVYGDAGAGAYTVVVTNTVSVEATRGGSCCHCESRSGVHRSREYLICLNSLPRLRSTMRMRSVGAVQSIKWNSFPRSRMVMGTRG